MHSSPATERPPAPEMWSAPGNRLKAFQVMAKPTGPICNLDCKYCFYLEKEKLYADILQLDDA